MNYCNALYPLITIYNALYIKALSKNVKKNYVKIFIQLHGEVLTVEENGDNFLRI